MRKPIQLIGAAVLMAGLGGPVLAQDASTAAGADTVMASVNGTDITLGHMILARATLPQQFQQLPPDLLFPAILDQLIQQTALAQSFDGELPPRVTLALENETRSLTAGEVVERVLQDAVTEEALQAIYDETYGGGEVETEYNASHILVKTEEEAQAVKTEIENGADFAETAKAKSTGPSGPGGGSLGWFGKGMMVPPFEAAVVAMEPGQVSGPVQTDFGWHVIRLNETRVKDAPEMEEVREEMLNKLRQSTVEAEIKRLTDASDIKRMDAGIDPNLLLQTDLLE